MEFDIFLDELQHTLKCVRVSVRSNTTEAYGRLCITANESGFAEFSTTTGSTGTLVKAIVSNVTTPSSISISYSDLQNFINPFKPWSEQAGGVKEVHFKLSSKSLEIKLYNYYGESKKSKSSIKLKLYPEHESFNKDFISSSFVFNSTMLRDAIDKTISIIDPIHTATYLRGLNLKFDDDNVYFAGTNGIAISEYCAKNTSEQRKQEYLLTYDFAKGIRSLLANLPKEEAQVEFALSDKIVKARAGNIIFWGLLIFDKSFPNYRVELLKEYKYKIVYDKSLFVNNLNPVISALDADDGNRMTITIEQDKMKLFNDLSSSEFELADGIKDTFIIDINGKLCKDLVNAIKDDKVIMYFNNAADNIMFDSEMFEDQKSLITFMRRRNI